MEGAANKPKRIQRKEIADYSFAFNKSQFSDRTLRMLISVDPQEIRYHGAVCYVLAYLTVPLTVLGHMWTLIKYYYCIIIIWLQKNDNNGVLQNSTETTTEVAQESSSDVTATHDANGAIEVRTVQVNSAILAESSLFFNKLFSNGMRETEQRHATVHISPSEEKAFIYLLKFMYGGSIETNSTKELLDVLVLADKFAVATCIQACTFALDSVPMTMEFASSFLCIPSSLLTIDTMRSIFEAAEGFLVTHFSNKEFVEEYMNLPLHIIEQMLTSDELCVISEDYIYDFAIKWANRHYQDHDERRNVFQNKLIKLIRFPQITNYKLVEILCNEDMHSASALKLVSEALNFKGEGSTTECYIWEKRFRERYYKLRPIRAIELHTPKREYRVFWDFNKAVRWQRSEDFYMWGRRFNLAFVSPVCYLHLEGENTLKRVEFVVYLRSKVSNDFCEVSRGNLTSVRQKTANFFELKSDVENYDFNNIVHVEAGFTYVQRLI